MNKAASALPASFAWLLVIGLTLLCWWLTIAMAMDFDATAVQAAWRNASFAVLSVMWGIMMAAMMLPSFIPTLHCYSRMLNHNAAAKKEGCFTAFVGGYLLLWLGFSLAAAFFQQQATARGVLDMTMAVQSPMVKAALFIAAGIFQLTPLKARCLKNCRHPLLFFLLHWRGGMRGALHMGLRNGLLCLGCCWLLMLLLFVGGVMNLYWIGLLTGYVLLEKILLPPSSRLITVSGCLLIGAGIAQAAFL